jgi:modulator of FtsH protease
MSEWSDFLVAAATALGALAGLLFVALSINLTHIINLPGVSGRALETLLVLAGGLMGALILLVPRQPAIRLGLALLVVAAPMWAVPMWVQASALRAGRYRRVIHVVGRIMLHQAAMVPMLLCGLSLCGLLRGGLLWFAIGVVLSLVAVFINAWVLLVEIVR